MCHSSERWTFWSRRQQHKTPEAMNRSDEMPRQANAVGQSVEPAVGPRKDEQVRRERELESVS
jgi:hypothetical protein